MWGAPDRPKAPWHRRPNDRSHASPLPSYDRSAKLPAPWSWQPEKNTRILREYLWISSQSYLREYKNRKINFFALNCWLIIKKYSKISNVSTFRIFYNTLVYRYFKILNILNFPTITLSTLSATVVPLVLYYARLICKVPRSWDFFSCLKKKLFC